MSKSKVDKKTRLQNEYADYSNQLLTIEDPASNQKKIGYLYHSRSITCTDLAEEFRQDERYETALNYCKAALLDIHKAKKYFSKDSSASAQVKRCNALVKVYENNIAQLELHVQPPNDAQNERMNTRQKRKQDDGSSMVGFVGIFSHSGSSSSDTGKRSRSGSLVDLHTSESSTLG